MNKIAKLYNMIGLLTIMFARLQVVIDDKNEEKIV